MVWIKVCGIHDPKNALIAAEAGVDAIGLNFHAPSPRAVTVEAAREIVAILPDSVTAVGLFVNRPMAEVLETIDTCGIGTIQFHGDETAEEVAGLLAHRPGLSVIRAVRFDGDFERLRDTIRHWDSSVVPFAYLVDAHVDGLFGGTGRTLPWDRFASETDDEFPAELVLAGGLTPANVAEAIRVVRPWGVDTASGVESSPGVKDADLVRAFVASARGW